MTRRLNCSVGLHEALLEQINALHIAGAAVAISKGESYVRGYAGIADVRTGGLINSDTQFEIGSTTKVFTATLIMRLCEQGLIELDAPVTRYLPDLKIDQRTPPDSLTVRTLLDYTAGMEGDFFKDFGEGDDSLRKYAEACSSLRYIHEPGKMRGYNSTAYCLAGRVIEVVTDKPYDQALSHLLMIPAGLKSFSYKRPRNAAFDYAVGHIWNAETEQFDCVGDKRLPKAMTASGARLSMPVHELHRFGQLHLFGGLSPTGEQLISSEAIEQMRTPFGTVPPHETERLMGWAAFEIGGTRFTIATGETVNQNSVLIYSPEHEFVLAILANATGGAMSIFSTLGLRLIEEYTGVKGTIPRPDLTESESDLKPASIVGRYTNGTVYSILERDGGLVLEAREKATKPSDPADECSKLVALGGARFGIVPDGFPSAVGAIEFLFETSGASTASHISQAGRLFARLPEA